MNDEECFPLEIGEVGLVYGLLHANIAIPVSAEQVVDALEKREMLHGARQLISERFEARNNLFSDMRVFLVERFGEEAIAKLDRELKSLEGD